MTNKDREIIIKELQLINPLDSEYLYCYLIKKVQKEFKILDKLYLLLIGEEQLTNETLELFNEWKDSTL